MMPSIFGENMFDDWFDFPFERSLLNGRNALYGKHGKNLMKTDIRDTGSSYELDIDLPGFKKDEIKAKVENGYLTISAEKGLDKVVLTFDGNVISASAAEAFILEKELSRKISMQNLRMAF